MSGEQPPVWKRLLQGWLAISARFGFVQTLVILGLFYGAMIGPAATLVSIARRDLLDKRRLRDPDSAWRQADSAAPDLERAKLSS